MREFRTDADLEDWLAHGPDRERSGDYGDWKLAGIAAAVSHLPTAPQRPVTIAGTKGKGSTLAFLESLLRGSGEGTLAFSSPHVATVRERWRIDGEPCPLSLLSQAAAEAQAAEEAAGAALSWFERAFLMACSLSASRPELHFLCEVGLGGRLDCSNVLDTRCAIITHLSLDHCNVLGSTVALIAKEKLAIRRPDAPLLVSADQSDDARLGVLAAVADENADQLSWVPPLPVESPPTLGLPGAHQRANAALAVAAVTELLADPPNEAVISQALANTHLPARCQYLPFTQGRRLLIDGAHNGPSVAATLQEAEQGLRPGYHIILGVAQDKDIEPILAALPADSLGADRLHRAGYDWPRARSSADWPKTVQTSPWHEDVAAALAHIPADTDCCITGSFYLAGEALTLLKGKSEAPPN